MAHIKIDRSALLHNLDLITRRAGGKERVAAVLKDNAYGHGLEIMAGMLQEYGITKAVVRTQEEARRIASFFSDIIILADMPEADGFSYAINDLEQLRSAPQGAKIELKVDSGMHRNGIRAEELEKAFRLIQEREVELVGVFTHFRSADELSGELFWQVESWKKIKEAVRRLCQEHGISQPRFHSANSATLFRYGVIDDFARVGIAMYGYLEIDTVFEQPPLRPVLSLWAKRLATRRLALGERVGYGGTFAAMQPMEVSTYDVGYADGIFRVLRSCAAGEVLGRVSMDNLSLAGKADEVCIIEDAKEMAHQLGTISYEVLVKLSPQIPRVVTQ